MADTFAAPSGHGQVQVYFTTNATDIELPEEKRQLRVPTGLSNLYKSIAKCLT
jgi:hypothetical protein